MAVFHGNEELTDKEYQIIVSVARGTVPDLVEEVVKQLYLRSREDYVNTKEIGGWCRFPYNTVNEKLQDLELLKIVTREKGSKGFPRWRLSKTVLRLMRELELYEKDKIWRDAKGGKNARKKKKIKKKKKK